MNKKIKFRRIIIMKTDMKRTVIRILLLGLLLAAPMRAAAQSNPAGRNAAAVDDYRYIRQQEGKFEGMAAAGADMQGVGGSKAVVWFWTADREDGVLKGRRTLFGGKDGPESTETVISGSRLAGKCTEAACSWEGEDGTLYILCYNKKKGMLTYIVADREGAMLNEGRLDIAGYYEKKYGKTLKRLYVTPHTLRVDAKGRLVARISVNNDGRWFAIRSETGKFTEREMDGWYWSVQEDGTPFMEPEPDYVVIDESRSFFYKYASHKGALYRIDMTGNIYKGSIEGTGDFSIISTGSRYVADPSVKNDRAVIDKEYFMRQCCVSGDGTKLYVAYWKGRDDHYENGDEVYHMVSYKLK